MKDLLITMPRVETLEEFMIQAMTCDNRLFERRQEKRLDWDNSYQSISNPSLKALGSSSSSIEPMQSS